MSTNELIRIQAKNSESIGAAFKEAVRFLACGNCGWFMEEDVDVFFSVV